MPQLKRNLLGLAAVLAAGFFATFVWPTVYRYDHMNLSGTALPVRIHRFSGKTEILYPRGWETAGQTSEQATAALPASELHKLEGNVEFRFSRFSCSVYNGTPYRVNEITVHLQVMAAGGQTRPVIDRDYRLKNSYFTDPLETGTFSQNVGFEPENDQKLSWYIKGASGIKR